MYRKGADLQKQLENIIADIAKWEQKLLKIATVLQPHIPFDYVAAGFNDMGQISVNGHSFLRIGFNEYQSIGLKELLTISGKSMDELIAVTSAEHPETTTTFYNNEAFEKITRQSPLKRLFAETFAMKSCLIMPLHLQGRRPFTFSFFSRKGDAFSNEHILLLNRLQYFLTTSIEAMMENEKTKVAG